MRAFFTPKAAQITCTVDQAVDDAAADPQLDAALTAADSDEAEIVVLEDWLAARPHLLKSIIPIPPDDIEVACMSLAKRGELVKRYGLPSVEAALKARGVSLSEIKPGRDADGGDAKRKRKAADTDAPPASNNPWSDKWRAPRPVKTDAEREELRLAAQVSIVKSFGTAGAVRYARSVGKTLANTPLRK
jgi:hypothetical protein